MIYGHKTFEKWYCAARSQKSRMSSNSLKDIQKQLENSEHNWTVSEPSYHFRLHPNASEQAKQVQTSSKSDNPVLEVVADKSENSDNPVLDVVAGECKIVQTTANKVQTNAKSGNPVLDVVAGECKIVQTSTHIQNLWTKLIQECVFFVFLLPPRFFQKALSDPQKYKRYIFVVFLESIYYSKILIF